MLIRTGLLSVVTLVLGSVSRVSGSSARGTAAHAGGVRSRRSGNCGSTASVSRRPRAAPTRSPRPGLPGRPGADQANALLTPGASRSTRHDSVKSVSRRLRARLLGREEQADVDLDRVDALSSTRRAAAGHTRTALGFVSMVETWGPGCHIPSTAGGPLETGLGGTGSYAGLVNLLGTARRAGRRRLGRSRFEASRQASSR